VVMLVSSIGFLLVASSLAIFALFYILVPNAGQFMVFAGSGAITLLALLAPGLAPKEQNIFVAISQFARRYRGIMYAASTILIVLALLVALHKAPPNDPVGARWASLLLLVAILPLVNAPFDWFSLGVTRALLR